MQTRGLTSSPQSLSFQSPDGREKIILCVTKLWRPSVPPTTTNPASTDHVIPHSGAPILDAAENQRRHAVPWMC